MGQTKVRSDEAGYKEEIKGKLMHIFWKISVCQDKISITPLSEEWLWKEAPNMGTSDPNNEDGFILTAPRLQLQELLQKNANNPMAFGNRFLAVWNRVQNGKELKWGETDQILKIKGNVERIRKILDIMVEPEVRADSEATEGKK